MRDVTLSCEKQRCVLFKIGNREICTYLCCLGLFPVALTPDTPLLWCIRIASGLRLRVADQTAIDSCYLIPREIFYGY